ncbi:hypothetical protein BGW42_005770 [Actinomortierella wolfii]|nr:hypothetical protein BGW42_005770 [Actinomortierella wolfii]
MSRVTAYLSRIIVLLLAIAALAGCSWMYVMFRMYHNVIIRWKYRSEFALAGITIFWYLASFCVQRLGKLRSKRTSEVNLTLGCILGIVWLHSCLRILISSERQVLPVDYPYTDRDNIGSWSSFDTPNDHNLHRCRGDPNSSMGETLSYMLCIIDRSTAIIGTLCGAFVIVESYLSYSCEKALRLKHELQSSDGDYALGYNPIHTNAVPPPTVVVQPTPAGYGAQAVPPVAYGGPSVPPPVPPVMPPYNPYDTAPAYDSRMELTPLVDDKKTSGKV